MGKKADNQLKYGQKAEKSGKNGQKADNQLKWAIKSW